MTEVWFRNPKNYIREVVEVGHFQIVWDRGILIKRNIDAHKFGQLYFGTTSDWRALIIGNQGTAEIDANHDLKNPVGVYPTWTFGENMDVLEEMMANPVGEDPAACQSNLPPDEKPVLGQEHRVVIANPPDARVGASREFYRQLKEMQEDYPECIVHVHGSHTFRIIFGMGYKSGDFEPRTDAANKRVVLPNGKKIQFPVMIKYPQWAELLGYKVVDLKDPRKRCLYNIESAIWASENWNENNKFKTRGQVIVDPKAVSSKPPQTNRSPYSGTAQEGDKIVCDKCSLSNSCKYYRQGAVCSIPGTESSTLARYFQSRDSGLIIDGLGAVLGAQTRRLEKGIADEELFDELDPQVSKELNSVFANGVKLAKLVDPALASPSVAVNIGNGGVSISAATTNQMMANVISAIEAKGIRREDITPQMVEDALAEMAGRPKAIEGEVVPNG